MFITIQPPAKVFDLKNPEQRRELAYVLVEAGVEALGLKNETITVATEGGESRQDLVYHLVDNQGRSWASRTMGHDQAADTDFLLTGHQFATDFVSVAAKIAEKTAEKAAKDKAKADAAEKKKAEKEAEKAAKAAADAADAQAHAEAAAAQ